MLNFRQWLENDEFPLEPSEYDPPNEKEMERIRKIPLSVDNPPDLNGDRYRFKMPLGEIQDFVVKTGAIIGLKAARGSLNAKCFQLLKKRDIEGLYKTLQYILGNQNKLIANQLFSHRIY